MWIAKVSQIIGSSSESFEDAARSVLARANRTLRGITEIEVIEKTLKVDKNDRGVSRSDAAFLRCRSQSRRALVGGTHHGDCIRFNDYVGFPE